VEKASQRGARRRADHVEEHAAREPLVFGRRPCTTRVTVASASIHIRDRKRDDERLSGEDRLSHGDEQTVDRDVERAIGDELEVALAHGLAREHDAPARGDATRRARDRNEGRLREGGDDVSSVSSGRWRPIDTLTAAREAAEHDGDGRGG